MTIKSTKQFIALLEQAGFRRTDAEVVAFITVNGGCRTSDIEKYAGIDRRSVAHAARRLSDDGIIYREGTRLFLDHQKIVLSAMGGALIALGLLSGDICGQQIEADDLRLVKSLAGSDVQWDEREVETESDDIDHQDRPAPTESPVRTSVEPRPSGPIDLGIDLEDVEPTFTVKSAVPTLYEDERESGNQSVEDGDAAVGQDEDESGTEPDDTDITGDDRRAKLLRLAAIRKLQDGAST